MKTKIMLVLLIAAICFCGIIAYGNKPVTTQRIAIAVDDRYCYILYDGGRISKMSKLFIRIEK